MRPARRFYPAREVSHRNVNIDRFVSIRCFFQALKYANSLVTSMTIMFLSATSKLLNCTYLVFIVQKQTKNICLCSKTFNLNLQISYHFVWFSNLAIETALWDEKFGIIGMILTPNKLDLSFQVPN